MDELYRLLGRVALCDVREALRQALSQYNLTIADRSAICDEVINALTSKAERFQPPHDNVHPHVHFVEQQKCKKRDRLED